MAPKSVHAALTSKFADLDTWQTRAALTLAKQIDAGDGVAGATRELRALVAAIEESMPKPRTGAVDVIAARRAAKRSAG